MQVVSLIRKAEDSAGASIALQDCFAMSKQQAEGVLNLSLRRLTSLEGKKLQEENDILSDRWVPTARCTPPPNGGRGCWTSIATYSPGLWRALPAALINCVRSSVHEGYRGCGLSNGIIE